MGYQEYDPGDSGSDELEELEQLIEEDYKQSQGDYDLDNYEDKEDEEDV